MRSYALLAMLLLNWVCWMLYLQSLAWAAKDEHLAEECTATCLAGVWTVVSIIFLGIVFILVLPYGGWFSIPAIITAAFLARLAQSGDFSASLVILMYPVGVPFMMRYLSLIGTIRMVLRRRL